MTEKTEWTPGQIIKEHRARLNMTMQDLSIGSGIHPNHIGMIERKTGNQSFHVNRFYAIIRGFQRIDPKIDIATFFPPDVSQTYKENSPR